MTSSTKIEPIYVVDTNALIWHLISDKRLSKRAAQLFAAAERGETIFYVSGIVIAEMYYANKKWNWFSDFAKTYENLKQQPHFQFIPFLADEVLDFDQDASVPEMHDRMVAGLARRLNAPLITSDPLIANAGVVTIEW